MEMVPKYVWILLFFIFLDPTNWPLIVTPGQEKKTHMEYEINKGLQFCPSDGRCQVTCSRIWNQVEDVSWFGVNVEADVHVAFG